MFFGTLEKLNAVPGDYVGQVVLRVIIPVLDERAVVVESVVVVSGVLDQPHPLGPTGRNVGARIFVQVLAEVACSRHDDDDDDDEGNDDDDDEDVLSRQGSDNDNDIIYDLYALS